MNPMKKKPMRILFSLLLVAVLVSTFSMTAFAASRILGMLPRAKFRRSSTMLFFPCAI